MKIFNKKKSQHQKNWKPSKNKSKKGKNLNRQSKLHIKFDPEDRREYLTGFQKRKRERREKALKHIEDALKAEKKQLRKDRKQIVKKMLHQGHELLENVEEEEEEEEDGEAVVTNCGSATVEIRGLDLTSHHQIGANQMNIKNEENQETKEKSAANGMESDQEEKEEEEDVSPENLVQLGIHSQKDLHRSLKKSSFQVLKHSSLMKKKQARDAKKQKKAQARKNQHKKKLKARKMRHRQRSAKDQEV